MDFAGIRIGHATDHAASYRLHRLSLPRDTVGSVDVRGPAPGSRESALLHPEKPVTHSQRDLA